MTARKISDVPAETKANGMVATAIKMMPAGTTFRGPTRSVTRPESRITQAAPSPCGAISRPATHGDWPRAIW